MILCVEDGIGIRDLMIYTLNSAGFEAKGLNCGAELFDAIKEERPQLIMLDIMLSGEDDIQILKRLRGYAATADIPVIMATAKGTAYDKVIGLDLGADDMKREEVDLFILAGETVKALSQAAENEHITLTMGGESAVITGIPQLLQSIVYNLCDNAIKYNHPHGSVTVTVENQADSVLLSVADTRIGIPLEHQERIFERFYRVDKSRSKELGGTGLGLSIVKHAVRLHGASIELQSVVDEGTTITVPFPRNANRYHILQIGIYLRLRNQGIHPFIILLKRIKTRQKGILRLQECAKRY